MEALIVILLTAFVLVWGYTVAVLARDTPRGRHLAHRIGAALRQIRLWHVAVVALLLGVFSGPRGFLLALFALAAVAFGLAWLHEFRYLMRLEDDAFPGHNDKLIWAILLIVLAPVGVLLFRSYRRAHWPEAKPAAGTAAFDDLV